MTRRISLTVAAVGTIVLACGAGDSSGSVTPADRLTDVAEVQLYVTGAACARTHAGHVYCWGDVDRASSFEEPGPGEPVAFTPRRVAGIDDAVRISTNQSMLGFGWAVSQTGELLAWSSADLEPQRYTGRGGKIQRPTQNSRLRSSLSSYEELGRDLWTARRTGIFVESPELFVDAGCLYSGGCLSCANIPLTQRGATVDMPSYEFLQWAYEPGLTDVVYVTHVDGWEDDFLVVPCLLFADGRVQCRPPSGRTDVQFPGKIVDLSAYTNAIALSDDGRVFQFGPDLVVQEVTGLGAVRSIQADDTMGCVLTEEHVIDCWALENTSARRRVDAVDTALQVSATNNALLIVESSGHIACAGTLLEGVCGSSRYSYPETHTYVPAPATAE
jgi:hypothetical protein